MHIFGRSNFNSPFNMKRVLLLLVFLPFLLPLEAKVEIKDFDIPTGVAPAFFGPNAFPVPDMLEGRTSATVKAELYAGRYWGTAVRGLDRTSDLFLRLTVPCFTERVNLSIWSPVVEFCECGPEANAYRDIDHDGIYKDSYPGDMYFSTDVMFLVQDRHYVDAVARAAIKTASGHRMHYARFYDAPGYFFDVSVGRDIGFNGGKTILRVSAGTGFMCWQTDVRRQNDAVMYSAAAGLEHGPFRVLSEFGGYVGWERHGDAPMTLKTSLSWGFGAFFVKAAYQTGLMDWPYHQLRLGFGFDF